MDTKHFNAYTIFALVFAFKLLFIFQGINLTDEGFHLTQQVAAYTEKVNTTEITAAYFLTQYAGGAWLHLWSTPNLLWARLGGVLVYALNAAIILQLLSGYFDKKKAFIIVVASTLFITMHEYSTIIHYYTFPALLLNTWLLTLSKLIKSQEGTRTNKTYGFLLGALITPIILSRITLAVILLLPGILLAYQRITKTENPQLKKSIPYMMAGLLAATIAFTLFYAQVGILDYYTTNIHDTIKAAATGAKDVGDFGEGHNIYDLIGYYAFGFASGIVVTITIGAVLIMFFDIVALTGKGGRGYFTALIILAAAVFIAVNAGDEDLRGFYVFAEYIQALAAFMLLLASAIILYADRKNPERTLLTLSGAYVLFITPLGSFNGLGRATYGMWLIMPLLILLAYEIKECATNHRLKSALSLLDSAMISLVIMSILFQTINIYTDNPNRLTLNTEFAYPPLQGIYSTPERVKVVDEALFQIDERTQKGDRILAVNSIPLLYYLTETKPALGDSWPIFRPIGKIRGDNEKMIAEGKYPKLFIYAKTEPGEPTWPKTNTTSLYPESFEYLKKEYTENLNYTLLWENEAFMIYGKEKK